MAFIESVFSTETITIPSPLFPFPTTSQPTAFQFLKAYRLILFGAFQQNYQKEKEKLIINDQDDFLRYQFENKEEWKPLQLDNIEERLDSLDQERKIRLLKEGEL